MSTKTKVGIRLLIFSVVGIGAIIMILPLVWMVITSFKERSEVLAMPVQWIPKQINLENYRMAFSMAPFHLYFFNSSAIAAAVTISNLFLCSLTGYVFAKFQEVRGVNVFFFLILTTMMIPFQVIIIPLYLVTKKIGLLDSYLGLMLPMLITPFGIFLMRQYISSLPNELLDAARIDGCNEFVIYWRVVFPLIKPALAILGALVFTWNWNTFLWPLIVVSSEKMQTLPLGLSVFEKIYDIEYHLLMAVSVVVMLPVLIIFVVLQRHLVRSVAITGLKF